MNRLANIKPVGSTALRWDGMWVTTDGPVRLRRGWTGPSDLVMLARGPEGWLLAILGERSFGSTTPEATRPAP